MAVMKVVIVPPNEPPRIEAIEDSLVSFHKIVDGYIEAYHLGHGFLAIVNEEGKVMTPPKPLCRIILTLVNLPGQEPRVLHTEWLAGQFFVCKQSGENWVGLTQQEADEWVEVFACGIVGISNDAPARGLRLNAQ